MNGKGLILWVLLLFGGLPFTVGAEQTYAPYPVRDAGYVTDLAGVLTAEQEEQLEGWIYTCEKETGVEMAVVTLDSIHDWPGTDNERIESFATVLFDAYGIGNLPENTGILLLVAVKDRKARIELGAGYGRSRDGEANRIMQKVILPQFKRDRYDAGILKGARALLRDFGQMRLGPGWITPEVSVILIVAGILLAALVTVSLFRSGKRGWGWVCAGLIIVLLLAVYVVIKKILDGLFSGHGRYYHRGHYVGGGYSGNFGGGFGGGFSGGGGATGSW